MASGNKIVIAFLSVSTEKSTDQLFEQIKRENEDFRCVFVKLTQQDLQSFQPGETNDAVVLLHSISQGRNSITDVADAKYSKLLPKLKTIYGPDRVAVVVHSMTSFNSNTKMALMMVFKKSQPTTFKCSNCVIQCNNLAEMRTEDLSRLTEFLGKVPDHRLPIAEDEALSTLTTTPSADKIYKIGTGHIPQSIPGSGSVTKGEKSMASSAPSSTDTSSMSQTEVGRLTNASTISIDSGSPFDPLEVGLRSEVALTQPTKGQTLITSKPSASTGDGNFQNMSSSTSQLGARSSDTAHISQSSSQGVTSPDVIEVERSEQYSAFPSDTGSTNDPVEVGLGSDDAPTPPTSSTGMGDGNSHHMGSSQLGTFLPDTAHNSQASSKGVNVFPVDPQPTSPDRDATQDKSIDTNFPIALFSLSISNQSEHLLEGLQRQFPVRSIMLIKDVQELLLNRHLFEAILVDLGSLQEAASYSSDEYKRALDIYQNFLKVMLVPQNLAMLMLAPADTHSADKDADIMSLISEISKTTEVSVFQYGSESCRPSLFDDNTKDGLVFWLHDCYKRYHAAILQKEPGFLKIIQTQLAALQNGPGSYKGIDNAQVSWATQHKVIDTTYPIALFSLSSSNQLKILGDELERQLPGKTIVPIDDKQLLATNCHLFEAILADLSPLQEAASCSSIDYKGVLGFYQKCLRKMLVTQNLALLMLAPVDTPSDHNHAAIINMISEIAKTTKVSVFQYGGESCRPSLFDDDTKNQLVSWLLDCYTRYNEAALREGPGFLKTIHTQLAKLFPSFLKKLGKLGKYVGGVVYS